jgi:hypothetical protein
MRRSSGPAIAVLVLMVMLPVAYVGGYCALVAPNSSMRAINGSVFGFEELPQNYRIDGDWPAYVFWPLEQIHRKLRPKDWRPMTVADWLEKHDTTPKPTSSLTTK